ncbi:MAG: isocitrate lyase/PEP mutase family protein [Nitrospirales bacterium]
MHSTHGTALRDELEKNSLLPFMGVYDVFSASIASRYFNGLFLSGFSFAASFYGLPDIGFICWSDLVAFTQRVRTILPHHMLVVDIDDGFGDSEIACHVVSLMEMVGASAIIMEDQKRPRRCGHLSGKQLLELPEYLEKLSRVIATRKELVIIARTDATDHEDRMLRAQAFADCGADVVLVEALPNLDLVRQIKERVKCPIMVNQIAGGKSPSWSFSDLEKAGVSLVNYSTPCLFAAQTSIQQTLEHLKSQDGRLLNPTDNQASLQSCNALLGENVTRRNFR